MAWLIARLCLLWTVPLFSPLLAFPTLIFDSDSGPVNLPLQFEAVDTSCLGADNRSVPGDHPLSMRLQPCDKPSSVRSTMNWPGDFWFRCHFSFTAADTGHSPVPVFHIISSGLIDPAYPTFLIKCIVGKTARGGFELQCMTRFSADRHKRETVRIPVVPEIVYCIETGFFFRGTDSVESAIEINGTPIASFRQRFTLPREIFRVVFAAPAHNSPIRELRIDRIALSKKKPYTIPAAPRGLTEEIADHEAILVGSEYQPFYTGEVLTGVEWLLTQATSGNPFTLELESRDPAFFNRHRIPFPLDSGTYSWRMRRTNNFGNTSEWSPEHRFRIPSDRPKTILITDAFLSRVGGEKPAPEIRSGERLTLHIRLQAPKNGWNDVGYIIAQLHHRSYLRGHPGNKGGRFSAKSNYVCNLSFNFIDQRLMIYEKQNEGAFWAERVFDSKGAGKKALYIDTSPESFAVDTLTGAIRVNLKLLRESQPGPWMLNVHCGGTAADFIKNKKESYHSNYFRRSFEVKSPKGRTRTAVLVVLILVGLTGFVLLKIRQRRKAAAVPLSLLELDFIRFKGYLIERLSDPAMTAQKARQELKFGKDHFYAVLKAGEEPSFPNLINKLKMEKAQSLLMESEKTISEIGFDLGFLEVRYFSTVFKKYTGMTPTEFKEKNRVRP